MPSTIASGTQSATGAHALDSAATTTAGVYVCMWNLTAMVNDDVVHCYVETKVLTGDTAERIYNAPYKHDQGNTPIVASPPTVSMHSLRMYVERVSGASPISIPWSLLRVDA
jgi:hypothetical protein